MSTLLRKLRGVVGIGLTWGVLWAAIGATIATIIGIVDPGSFDPGESRVTLSGIVGFVGLVSGVCFGADPNESQHVRNRQRTS
jgi:hypothetical protein